MRGGGRQIRFSYSFDIFGFVVFFLKRPHARTHTHSHERARSGLRTCLQRLERTFSFNVGTITVGESSHQEGGGESGVTWKHRGSSKGATTTGGLGS